MNPVPNVVPYDLDANDADVTSRLLTKRAQEMYDQIPEDGSTISNPRLQELVSLGNDDKTYWSLRDELVDAGLIERRRGRGGTLCRVTNKVDAIANADPGSEEVESAQQSEWTREQELYEPMRTQIESNFAPDKRWETLAVQVVAGQGSRATGGVWSRPDIVAIEIRTFQYVPGKFLEIVTFEVKPSYAVNVQAVYEALAHRRSATRSYVLLHVPADLETSLEDELVEVCLVARSHGIGVIVAADPSDYATWEEKEEAIRHQPDPGRLEGFIETQLSSEIRKRVAKAIR